jgi:hypothetical protein
VLWKEFKPLLHNLLPSGECRLRQSVASALLDAVVLLGDVLGWGLNPASLSLLHERAFAVALELERVTVSFWPSICSHRRVS